MASVTVLGTTWTTAVGDKTVVATPAVGDYIAFFYATAGAGTETASDNNSGGGGTYQACRVPLSLPETRGQYAGAGSIGLWWVRGQPITSATSTTFTAGQSSSTGGGLCVIAISGITKQGARAVRSGAVTPNGTAGTTPAPVLKDKDSNTVSALTTSVVLIAIVNASNPAGITPRSGFTEDPTPDLGFTTPTSGLETEWINTGETASTLTVGSTSATQFGAYALEIDTSLEVPPPTQHLPYIASNAEHFGPI